MSQSTSITCPSFIRPVVAASLLMVAAALFAGCGSHEVDPPGPSKIPAGKLRFLVIDDPPLAEAIEREWAAQGRSENDVIRRSAADMVEQAELGADIIVFPSAMLGELVESERILPLPDTLLADDALAFDAIFPLLRRQEICWGRNQPYALPLGSPQLVLMYRPGIFQQLDLTPPASWQEYEAVANALQANGFQVVEPLAPGWAGKLLLARAAAYAKHRSQFSVYFDYASPDMTPLIDREPFVRALTELAAAVQDPIVNETPQTAAEMVVCGECAMAVSWPSKSMSVNAAVDDSNWSEVAIAELPGSVDVYNFFNDGWEDRPPGSSGRVPLLGTSGRLAAVTSESSQRLAAFDAIGWLASTDVGIRLSPFSGETTVCRDSHVPQAAAWLPKEMGRNVASEYGELMRTVFGRPSAVCSLRIPGRERYLAALDAAVLEVVVEGVPPAKALSAAADKWRELNEELGVEKQRAAYRRSVGADR